MSKLNGGEADSTSSAVEDPSIDVRQITSCRHHAYHMMFDQLIIVHMSDMI